MFLCSGAMFGILLRECLYHGFQAVGGCLRFRESISVLVMNPGLRSSGAKACMVAASAVLPPCNRGEDAYLGNIGSYLAEHKV